MIDPQNTVRGYNPWRICIAPMLDWTDRHCRYFHRLLTRHARLYTEMVTTGALIHGDVPRHLDFSDEEHPVALQLGGSDPTELAHAARLGARWGYDEINLNCGCPSERVQKGSFGACLMREPSLVADGIKAMRDAVTIPVTVKHRISVDGNTRPEVEDDYGLLRDFVGTLAEAGCEVFIVHARTAILKGLSPRDNREIPPLRWTLVEQLRRDFPALTLVGNGGITSDQDIDARLQHLDGVMIGRAAYQNPGWLRTFDQVYFGDHTSPVALETVVESLHAYLIARSRVDAAFRPHNALRHIHGLVNGMPGARRFRQTLSNASRPGTPPEALLDAWRVVCPPAPNQSSECV